MKIQPTSVYSGTIRIEGDDSLIDIDLCDVYSHIRIGAADPDKYDADGQRQPTSRLLDGSIDDWAAEEWAQSGTYDGKPCTAVYLFDADDIVDDEGDAKLAEDYPWDYGHMARIVLDED